MRYPSSLLKIRGRSFDELRVRSMQALAAGVEWSGLSPQSRLPEDEDFLRRELRGAFPTAEALLEHFRVRDAPRFFSAFAEQEALCGLLRRRWPEQVRATVEKADRVSAGRFDLLGRTDLDFGDPIDWRAEPVSGLTSPLLHWSRIDHLDPERVGEYKITWELNRHQHFLALGQAYWETGDERYVDAFAAHLASWSAANPPKRGINWGSSLEVAFRAIAWVWALHFFRESPRLTPRFFLHALKMLHLHARHLETYLSTYYSPNTHLTGEALGMFYLGTLFPELRLSSRWQRTALRILLRQLEIQIRPDGVYFEQASYYHRYTVDFYTHLFILCAENEIELPNLVTDRLQAMLDHLLWITRPDGTTPLYGDDDGGRLVPLERRAPNDFRAALSTGAALFGRGDYRHVAGSAAAETVWLLGTRGIDRFDAVTPKIPHETSRAFPDGGYFVMRDGWSADSRYLLVDCGPHGAQNCGHAHADALAFDLAAGRSFLVDPGTFTYINPPSLRDHFRSTGAHNTVTVESRPSSAPAGPFQWRDTAECELTEWIAGARFDFFAGRHDGFCGPPNPACHSRSILFIKGGYWVMRDVVTSRRVAETTAHLQFAPGVRVSLRTNGLSAISGDERSDPALDIVASGGSGGFRCSDGWVSRAFGERVVAPHCELNAAGGNGASDVLMLLVPRHRGEAPAHVLEIPLEAGRGLRLERPGQDYDLLLVSDHGDARDAGVVSDFAWSWLRMVGGGLREYVLIGGTRLEIDGRDVVCSERPMGYVEARLEENVLRVRTDTPDCLFVDSLGAGDVQINSLPREARVDPSAADRRGAATPARGVASPEPD